MDHRSILESDRQSITANAEKSGMPETYQACITDQQIQTHGKNCDNYDAGHQPDIKAGAEQRKQQKSH